METVPSAVLNKEILGRLDIEALCSLACVNRALRFSVESQALPSLSSLHLSVGSFPLSTCMYVLLLLCTDDMWSHGNDWQTISPDGQTLIHILGRCKGLCSLTLNCLRLQDHSLCAFLTPRIRELNLWCCSSLSYQILASIGHNCPNLRWGPPSSTYLLTVSNLSYRLPEWTNGYCETSILTRNRRLWI